MPAPNWCANLLRMSAWLSWEERGRPRTLASPRHHPKAEGLCRQDADQGLFLNGAGLCNGPEALTRRPEPGLQVTMVAVLLPKGDPRIARVRSEHSDTQAVVPGGAATVGPSRLRCRLCVRRDRQCRCQLGRGHPPRLPSRVSGPLPIRSCLLLTPTQPRCASSVGPDGRACVVRH